MTLMHRYMLVCLVAASASCKGSEERAAAPKAAPPAPPPKPEPTVTLAVGGVKAPETVNDGMSAKQIAPDAGKKWLGVLAYVTPKKCDDAPPETEFPPGTKIFRFRGVDAVLVDEKGTRHQPVGGGLGHMASETADAEQLLSLLMSGGVPAFELNCATLGDKGLRAVLLFSVPATTGRLQLEYSGASVPLP